MFRNYFVIVFILLLLCDNSIIRGQTDTIPPKSPVLDLVSVDYLPEDVNLSWSLSPSPDVIGYIVYLFKIGRAHV